MSHVASEQTPSSHNIFDFKNTNPMSLARAFTTKKASRPSISAPMPTRSLTTKHSFPSGSIRHKISGPVELISTTNMLSYNAPDLHPISTSANSSGDESDVPEMSHSASTTPDSSIRGSTPISPEPNHLSIYFATPAGTGRQSTSSGEDAPSIPKRAPSHTKKTHEILSRQRSISRISSSSGSTHRKASVTSFARSSVDMFSPHAHAEAFDGHPFGPELAQVTELAEEYGVRENMQVIDEEEQELLSRGLFKFSAQDYADEIRGLFADLLGETQTSSAMWI